MDERDEQGAPAPDQEKPEPEAEFLTDSGQTYSAPFQKGTQIDLNGRIFVCAKLTKKDVILELVREQPSRGGRKPIRLKDHFEFKGWLFQINHIQPAQIRRKGQGRKWHPYTISVRPTGIRKSTSARLLKDGTPADPGNPTGFIIERTGDGESPIPNVPAEQVEQFAQKILDQLIPPDAQEARGAWALGVKSFFEGGKSGDCPWNDSGLIILGEPDEKRMERIFYGRAWKNGWEQAYNASLRVYEAISAQAGGSPEQAAAMMEADALAEARAHAPGVQAEEGPPAPGADAPQAIQLRAPAAELMERARRLGFPPLADQMAADARAPEIAQNAPTNEDLSPPDAEIRARPAAGGRVASRGRASDNGQGNPNG